MEMSQIFTPQFISQSGLAGIVLFLAYKAIGKLYADMREDSVRRENKLMIHLDKVSDTLEKIDNRLCALECKEDK